MKAQCLRQEDGQVLDQVSLPNVSDLGWLEVSLNVTFIHQGSLFTNSGKPLDGLCALYG